MAVHILALSVVIVQNVGSFEGENFGNAYHAAKISILKFNIEDEFRLAIVLKILNLVHNQFI